METRRTARGAVRDRIDAADQAIMARLSAESSPLLDRFLPALSRSADFFVLWIGIAAALAASKDERAAGRALRGLAGMVIASTASNVLAKGLVRRPRPAGEVPPDRRPGRTPVTTSFPSGTPPPRRRSPLASGRKCPPWRRRSGRSRRPWVYPGS